jgi:Transposase
VRPWRPCVSSWPLDGPHDGHLSGFGRRRWPRCGASGSDTSLLPPTPTAIGLDDCAFRRGKPSGTLSVDLESHRLLDLLPARTTAPVEAWLRAHPGRGSISRDRAGEDALAAARAAPHALQIAERFHWRLNAGEGLARFLPRHPSLGQEADASPLPRSARRSQAERAAQEQPQERRRTLYQRGPGLTKQGHTHHERAEILGSAGGTVIGYHRAKQVPP